jgi:hypothetical protein
MAWITQVGGVGSPTRACHSVHKLRMTWTAKNKNIGLATSWDSCLSGIPISIPAVESRFEPELRGNHHLPSKVSESFADEFFVWNGP